MTQKNPLIEKLADARKQIINNDVQETRAELIADNQEDKKAMALMLFGGLRAVNSLQNALNSQVIRKLQLIRDERLFTEFMNEQGEPFKRFDDFLNQSPYSPMKYDRFNYHEQAFLKEGDELFNALNAIDAPLSKRRLLGKGDLSLEGENIVVKCSDEHGQASITTIPVTDRSQLLLTLSKVLDERNEKSRTVERGRKEIEVLKRKLDAKPKPSTEDSDLTPLSIARLKAMAGIGRLSTVIRTLPRAERIDLREKLFADLTPYWDDLNAACLYDAHPADKNTSDIEFPDDLLQAEMDAQDALLDSKRMM